MKLIEIKVGMDLFTSRIVSSKPVVQGENLVTRIMAEFPSEYAEWSHFVEFRSGTQHILLPLDKNDEVNVPEEFSAINFPKLEIQFQCRNAQQVAVDQTVLYIDVLKGTNVISDFTAPEDELNLMMDHIASYDNPHGVTSDQVTLAAGICNLQAKNVQEALVALKQLIDLGGGKAPTDVIQTLKQHDQDITRCKEAVNNLKVDIARQDVTLTDKMTDKITKVQDQITKVQDQLGNLKETLLQVHNTLSSQILDMKTDFEHHFQTTDEEVDKNYTEFLNHVNGAQQKFTQYDSDIAALKAAIGGGSGGGGDTGDIDALEKALDELEASVNAMDAANKAAHAALEARMQALETAKDEHAQKIAALEDNVGAINQTTQDLANSVAASASGVEELKGQVSGLDGRLQVLEDGAGITTDLSNRMAAVEAKAQQNEDNIAAVRASEEATSADLASFKSDTERDITKIEGQITAQSEKIGGFDQRVSTAEANIGALSQKALTTDSQIAALDKETENLAAADEALGQRVTALEESDVTTASNIQALQNKDAEQDAKIAGLNDNIAALDNTTQNLSAKVTTAVGELNKKTDDLSGRIEVLEDAGGITSDLSDRMAAVEEKAQQNADNIAAVRASGEATASDLNAFKSDTERDINRMDSQITAQSEKIGGFDQRVSTAEANIGALSQKALTTDSQIAALDKETENLAAADEALGQRVTALEESDVTTASNIQALQNKDAEQDAKIAGQEARITALENSSVDDDIAALEQKLDSHISGASHEFGRIEAEYKAADAALEQRLDSHISGASHEFGRIEAEYKAADAALDKKVSEHITGASQEFGRLDAAVRELQDGQEKQGDDIRALRQKDIEQDTNLAATNVNVETNAYNIEQMRDRLGKVEESVAGITGDIAEEVEKIAGPIIEQKVDEAVAGSLGEYVTKTELNTEVTKVVTQKISELVDSGDVVTKTEVENIVNEALAPAIAEATKDFVTDAEMEAAIQEALQGVTVDAYTKAEADERFALKTDIPDLSDYALKSEIPDVSGLATKEELSGVIQNVTQMQTDLAAAEENITNLQTSVANVYTKEEADAKFASTGEGGTVYTKTEIDDIVEQIQTTASVEWGTPLEAPVGG